MVSYDEVVDVIKLLFLVEFLPIIPTILASVVVAVVIGLVQTMTGVQEQGVLFIAKLLTIGVFFYFAGGIIGTKLIEAAREFLIHASQMV